MSKRTDREFLRDIQEAITRIEKYTFKMKFKEFLNDTKTQDAVIRNIEIIGEAVKNISANFKQNHKDIEWKLIAGMRDRIIHFYFGIKWDVVWDVVKNNIPEFKSKIEYMLKEFE
ncbi:MAG TPA: DUF86 domain-containing protein [bacterium]|nr:DUF86 domain-containing protein [bacterium]HPP30255.1 DUF86 domain-containing protein [bacterium]